MAPPSAVTAAECLAARRVHHRSAQPERHRRLAVARVADQFVEPVPHTASWPDGAADDEKRRRDAQSVGRRTRG